MVKHTHKAGESLIGMPEEILIRYHRDYNVAYFTGTYFDCGEGITFDDDDSFDWYDLTELGE